MFQVVARVSVVGYYGIAKLVARSVSDTHPHPILVFFLPQIVQYSLYEIPLFICMGAIGKIDNPRYLD